MPFVAEKAINYLREHPDASGTDLWRLGIAESRRTGTRWRRYFEQGVADPSLPQMKVSSQVMDELADEEDDDYFDVEQFLKVAPDLVKQAQRRDPVITHDVLNFNTDHPIAVFFPSCVHLGSRYTEYVEFREIFNQVLGMERVYWASLGDDIEGMLASFRDVDAVQGQLLSAAHQVKLLASVLGKLAEKNKLILGMSSQHGGQWYDRQQGHNPVKDLYLSYGVPFFDGKAYVKFVVGKQSYNIAIAHEFPGNSLWNPLHPQGKAFRFDFPNADVIVMGDKHKFAAMEIPASGWETEAGNRESDRVLLLQSGTAKTGPDKYTIRGWSKGQLGWPVVVFYPDEHRWKWSWDLADVEHWLNEA